MTTRVLELGVIEVENPCIRLKTGSNGSVLKCLWKPPYTSHSVPQGTHILQMRKPRPKEVVNVGTIIWYICSGGAAVLWPLDLPFHQSAKGGPALTESSHLSAGTLDFGDGKPCDYQPCTNGKLKPEIKAIILIGSVLNTFKGKNINYYFLSCSLFINTRVHI